MLRSKGRDSDTYTSIAYFERTESHNAKEAVHDQVHHSSDFTLTLLADGKPPVALKPGDFYQIPVNAIHDAKSGESGAKILAVYIVEKGKPLASAAP